MPNTSIDTGTEFASGARACWSSQSQGYRRTKHGAVVEVLRPGQRPDREKYPSLYTGAGVGGAREHVSYVVQVQEGKAKPKFYWPLVKHLRLDTQPDVSASISTGAGR